MRTIIITLLLICFSIGPASSQGGKHLTIDLGLLVPKSSVTINENAEYDYILLKNVVNNFAYSIEVNRELDSLPVLDFGNMKSGLKAINVDSMCKVLRKAINKVNNIQNDSNTKIRTEKELGKWVSIIEYELRKNSCDSLKAEAKKAISSTYRYLNKKVKVGSGEKVTITIKRDSLTWTYILKGESLGKWVTTYGFGFTFSFLDSPTYYTKQNSNDSKYQILKSRRPNVADLSYIPAIFFSYFPNHNFTRCWNHSLTGGLGFDLSAPVVFFGYNGLFRNNIGFSAGVAFQQQYRLKSQYSENDIVDITLEKDQLHDKIYRPNLFVAVNFRFGENPFMSNNQKSKE